MTTKYVNNSNITLSMAAWLAYDDYDHNDDPNVISATALIKPLRQIILGNRIANTGMAPPVDIMSKVNSRMGQSIHAGVEDVWLTRYKLEGALAKLGIPKRIINKIKVNPDPKDLVEGDIPVYLEQRLHREVHGYIVSGKFDFCFDGELEDVKSTGTFYFNREDTVAAYVLQGSIYRFLDPVKITSDHTKINYVFKDWKPSLAKTKDYPPAPQVSVEYPLMSLVQTENWLIAKLKAIEEGVNTPEPDLPFCTDEELWKEKTVWKYYAKSEAESSRSTKNFDNEAEGKAYLATKGFKGELVEAQGKVKACHYCPGYELCTQKNIYLLDGTLTPK